MTTLPDVIERHPLLMQIAVDIELLSKEALVDDCAGDPAQLVYLLDALRSARKELATLEAIVEAAAANALPRRRLELVDIVAEVKGGASRSEWQHAEVADRIATLVCVDPDTAEIDPDAYSLAHVLVTAIIECAAFSYWRVAALRARGVRFDDLCKRTKSRKTVVLSKAKL